MDSTEFYSLIDSARESADPLEPSAVPDALRDVLDELDDDVLTEFAIEYARQHARLNRWSIWGAGFVIAGGMSDDSFHYFRSWLIGKGSDVVEQALDDPDELGVFIDEDDEVENEELEYVAKELLDERGLDSEPQGPLNDDGDPIGTPFDEETTAKDYPQLSVRFG